MFALGAGFSTGLLILAGNAVLQEANAQFENMAQLASQGRPAARLSLPFSVPFDAPFNLPSGKLEAVANAIKPRAVQLPNRILF